VFDRDRIDDDAIEFDFFDESPTTEAVQEPGPPRRRPRLPTRPPAGGTPLLRLAALIAGGILLAVVLVLWISSCREDQKAQAYEDYMSSVGRVAGQSAEVGTRLNQLVFTAGIEVEDLQTQLDGLRTEQSQTVRRAEEIDPPGPLRRQHQELIEALELRVSGLNGLARALSQVSGLETGADAAATGTGTGTETGATDTTADGDAAAGDAAAGGDATAQGGATGTAGVDPSTQAGTLLAEQAARLIASDVVYEDLFQAPASRVMADQGVSGVATPESNFVTNAEFASPNSWKLIIDRLTKPPAATGLHGNRIAAVRWLPASEELSRTDENTVQATDDLGFEVVVENSGDSQETQVNVTLTLQQSPEPERKEATIDAINPGEAKSVVFRDFNPSFGPRTILKVTVEPVAGEENTNNNTAEYVVIFTFG
jgi:hypothetical protein